MQEFFTQGGGKRIVKTYISPILLLINKEIVSKMNEGSNDSTILDDLRSLFGLEEGENFEASTSKRAKELWPIPPDTPEEVRAIMPGETNVKELLGVYWGQETPPGDWDMQAARGLINFGRQKIYLRFRQGFYKEHPEFLQRPDSPED